MACLESDSQVQESQGRGEGHGGQGSCRAGLSRRYRDQARDDRRELLPKKLSLSCDMVTLPMSTRAVRAPLALCTPGLPHTEPCNDDRVFVFIPRT